MMLIVLYEACGEIDENQVSMNVTNTKIMCVCVICLCVCIHLFSPLHLLFSELTHIKFIFHECNVFYYFKHTTQFHEFFNYVLYCLMLFWGFIFISC